MNLHSFCSVPDYLTVQHTRSAISTCPTNFLVKNPTKYMKAPFTNAYIVIYYK